MEPILPTTSSINVLLHFDNLDTIFLSAKGGGKDENPRVLVGDIGNLTEKQKEQWRNYIEEMKEVMYANIQMIQDNQTKTSSTTAAYRRGLQPAAVVEEPLSWIICILAHMTSLMCPWRVRHALFLLFIRMRTGIKSDWEVPTTSPDS